MPYKGFIVANPLRQAINGQVLLDIDVHSKGLNRKMYSTIRNVSQPQEKILKMQLRIFLTNKIICKIWLDCIDEK